VTRALVAVVVALALIAPATAGAAERPRASDLEAELVCPTCKTTLDQSDAPVARRMKEIIRERIVAGASADEIKRELVDQFGPGVLAEPPKSGFDLLAWALPLAALVGGAVVVGVLAWSWSRRRDTDDAAVEAVPLDPETDRRIDEELARLEQ
jgi:cytochrome c-type biogenesis protein CcmH